MASRSDGVTRLYEAPQAPEASFFFFLLQVVDKV